MKSLKLIDSLKEFVSSILELFLGVIHSIFYLLFGLIFSIYFRIYFILYYLAKRKPVMAVDVFKVNEKHNHEHVASFIFDGKQVSVKSRTEVNQKLAQEISEEGVRLFRLFGNFKPKDGLLFLYALSTHLNGQYLWASDLYELK